MDLKNIIRNVPDFPKKGVMYRDITTLLKDPDAMKYSVSEIVEHFKNKKIDFVAGIESRGFIIAPLIAEKFHCGFIPVRKVGKLPAETIKHEYELEYGTDTIEIHFDAVRKGDNVLICDDLLATGGTSLAATKLIEKLGGKVSGLGFIVELDFLNGRKRLNNYDVFSLVHYTGEE
ncbi:MAG: adenine phosphoribosyltransferase [Candidatus Diapherotrites archaeon]